MVSIFDDDEYFEHVLAYAEPGNVGATPLGPVAEWREFWRRRWLDCGDDVATRLARAQGFVATPRQLRDVGWTSNDLRREIRRGSWWSPAFGAASPITVSGTDHSASRRRHTLAATAQALTREAVVISGRSGAIVHGLPTVSVPEQPELTAPSLYALGKHGNAHVHRATMAASDIDDWYGAPVTTPSRTIVDLGRHDRFDAIMALDAALREDVVTEGEIVAALEQARGWPGVAQARAVLALGDGRAESPLESVVRLRLHEDGFPPAEPQVWIPDPVAGKRYRVDLLMAAERLVIEADGRGKYTDDALWEEKKREARLRELGFRVERVIWSDVFVGWDETAARLWCAIRAS